MRSQEQTRDSIHPTHDTSMTGTLNYGNRGSTPMHSGNRPFSIVYRNKAAQ